MPLLTGLLGVVHGGRVRGHRRHRDGGCRRPCGVARPGSPPRRRRRYRAWPVPQLRDAAGGRLLPWLRPIGAYPSLARRLLSRPAPRRPPFRGQDLAHAAAARVAAGRTDAALYPRRTGALRLADGPVPVRGVPAIRRRQLRRRRARSRQCRTRCRDQVGRRSAKARRPDRGAAGGHRFGQARCRGAGPGAQRPCRGRTGAKRDHDRLSRDERQECAIGPECRPRPAGDARGHGRRIHARHRRWLSRTGSRCATVAAPRRRCVERRTQIARKKLAGKQARPGRAQGAREPLARFLQDQDQRL